MRPSRRCTTTSATACTARRSIAAASPTSRIRSAAAVRSRPACAGFTSFPAAGAAGQGARQAGTFADHYTQATLFWNSQTPVEKAHIIRAFRFELTKVQTPAVRERVVAMLANVADELARRVARGLGMTVPAPLPRALEERPQA